MSDEPSLESLRGLTLDEITVDWRNGLARVTFLPAASTSQSFAVRVTDVTRVGLERKAGASRVVRDVRRHAGGGASAGGPPSSLEIEVLSGEVVVVEARAFALERITG